MSFEIPTRAGLKVYVNEGGTITIQQTGSGMAADPFVDLHPADLPRFVAGLNRLLDDDLKNSKSPKP